MNSSALQALHVAARSIKDMKGITNVSVDNDNKGGEIFFDSADLDTGVPKTYKMTLTEVEE